MIKSSAPTRIDLAGGTLDIWPLYLFYPQFKEDKKARRAKIREIINPKFHYIEMGKRSLAKNWKKLSSEEKKEFVDLFAKLLENSYASKIESYRDEKINYVDEASAAGWAAGTSKHNANITMN